MASGRAWRRANKPARLPISPGDSDGFFGRRSRSKSDALNPEMLSEHGRKDLGILRHNLSVEISACTGHARRRPLAEILACGAIKQLLEDQRIQWHSQENRDNYFQALEDEGGLHFLDRYGPPAIDRENDGPMTRKRNKKIRQRQRDWDTAISLSMRALKRTGLDKEFGARALWKSSTGHVCDVLHSHEDFHWTGLLVDTPESCAFPFVSRSCFGPPGLPPSCLEFEAPFSYHGIRELVRGRRDSCLEISLVINEDAGIPDGLKRSTLDWHFRRAEKGFKFKLGDSGQLVYLEYRYGTVWMKWIGKSALQGLREAFKTSVKKGCPIETHREYLSGLDAGRRRPLVVLVTSRLPDRSGEILTYY